MPSPLHTLSHWYSGMPDGSLCCHNQHHLVIYSHCDDWVFDSYIHTQPFNGLFSRTTWVSRYQKGKTNLDFTGARDSEWQWHQLGHMQVCTSLQTDNHASTPPLGFLQAGCPSCRPTNSVKALKALYQPSHRMAKTYAVCPAAACWCITLSDRTDRQADRQTRPMLYTYS